MKDMAPLKEEAYTSSIDNYITKVQFQMASIQMPNRPVENVMNSWEKTAEDMEIKVALVYWQRNAVMKKTQKLIERGQK